MSKINTHLEPTVHVNKYSFDIIEDYELDQKTGWVNDLLIELEEDNEDNTSYSPSSMTIKAQITRKTNNFLNDHLVVRADLVAHFHLPCGRCLYPLSQELNLSLSAAFLHEAQEKKPEYAEVTTVFADARVLLKSSMVLGPMSTPSQPSGMPRPSILE
jgi:uncharacterized metal-binding protein YceD (DUF177 family)